MKKVAILLIGFIFAFYTNANAETILLEDFEDNIGFTTAGHASGYWGIAPLSGTASIPSSYIQAGSQSGNIFYGSFGKDFSNLTVDPTMTITLPNLSDYTDITLTVALAAPYEIPGVMWEISHRDKLLIDSNIGNIDTFRPISNASPLQSIFSFTNIGYTFQDFQSNINSIIFTFASTDYPETVGIDSVRITGNPLSPSAQQILEAIAKLP